jgi:hypothetical protein
MKMSFCHALAKEMKIQICTTYLAIQEKNTAVRVFISLVDGVDLYLKSFIFLNAYVIAGGRHMVSLQTTATILLTIESTI